VRNRSSPILVNFGVDVPRYHAATNISPSLMHLLWPPNRAGHYILQLCFIISIRHKTGMHKAWNALNAAQ